jgi:hypothetical protein
MYGKEDCGPKEQPAKKNASVANAATRDAQKGFILRTIP